MSATLLVANRGEIALRIIRTATELGMRTVAVYADDDADSPHVHAADEAIGLAGDGPKAYLDSAALLAAAEKSGAELVHPGYGFLSESAAFARACGSAGRTFVGPDAGVLELLGDKAAARAAATSAAVPVLPATGRPQQRRRRPRVLRRPERRDHDQGARRRGRPGTAESDRRGPDRGRLPAVRRRGPTRLRRSGAVRRSGARRREACRGAGDRRAGRAPNPRAGGRRPRLQHPAALSKAHRNRSGAGPFGIAAPTSAPGGRPAVCASRSARARHRRIPRLG